MTGPRGDRPPISWEALAAELATGLTGEPEDGAAGRTVEAWDAAAARVAAGLGPATAASRAGDPAGTTPRTPAPDPAMPDQLPDDPAAEEEAATGAEAPSAAPPRGRAPQQPSVELLVVDPPEPAVEETVPAPEDLPDDGAAASPEELRGGLEALLFVADGPVDEVTLAAALRCPVGQVRTELAGLAAGYDQRRAGMTLRRVGEGWRVYTREEHAEVVERYLLEGQRSRLTQAALETLAVIAYRQPVTRARVSAIRGVGVDAVVRTLVTRGLIRECGSDPDTGGGLYATTPLFLERLGLTSLDELPELAPLLPEPASLLDEHPDA